VTRSAARWFATSGGCDGRTTRVVFAASSTCLVLRLTPSTWSRLSTLVPHAAAGFRRPALLVASVVIVSAVSARPSTAQQADSTPRLGLAASSALSVYAGMGQFKYSALGPDVGAALDLGWFGSRHVRLSVGIDYLSTTIDRADSLGVRQRGPAYVFTGVADVNAMGPIRRRFTPYGGLGFGVDAVGTTIANDQVGGLYNTNVLNLHAQLGTLIRLTPRGRLRAEARVTGARVVRRYSVRVGYTWLFNGLREEDHR
jgi:hypothetical protein